MILSSVFTALAATSILLNLWQWIASRRFPLYQAETLPVFTPPLSILKPLKGCDSETESCLESWFLQDYPAEHELLFGVASSSDPVCETVRRLIEKYPSKKAALIIADSVLGPNPKVSSLCYLAKSAQNDYFVVSDADVFVENNFLRNLVSDLRKESVTLVNSFYILAAPQNLPMRLEALSGNADFWTQILQAISLRPMDFALGAAMVFRRTDLLRAGGFESILEYLADDYQLGRRIAKKGGKFMICRTPVECRSAPFGWRDLWEHQLRWARTIRTCRPAPYFFSILGNATIWPMFAAIWGGIFGKSLFLMALAIRMLGALSKYSRFTRKFEAWVAPLAPINDIGQALVWVVSFLGRTVIWRGERFRVDRGGKLTRLA